MPQKPDHERIIMTPELAELRDCWGYRHRCKTTELFGASLGFIPPQLRYYDPATNISVLEFPPRYMTIEGTKREVTPSWYVIPTPWLVFVGTRDNLYIFARPSPLHSLDDDVYHASYLSNIHADATMCGIIPTLKRPGMGPVAAAMDRVGAFWLSPFNGGVYYTKSNHRHLIVPEAAVHFTHRTVSDYIWPTNWIQYLEWLETQTPAGLCGWAWVKANPLSSYLTIKNKTGFSALVDQIRTKGRVIH